MLDLPAHKMEVDERKMYLAHTQGERTLSPL